MNTVNNFVVIESVYGKFLLNRHCVFQAETLIKTGYTHIESELANIFTIIDRLPTDCLVVDGGANAGFFTVPVAQRIKHKNGRVISFEPQREIFNGLAGTIALNDLDNVRLNRMGLGNVAGQATLPDVDYSQDQDFGVVTIEQRDEQGSLYDIVVDQQSVETIRLDDLVLPRLDFYKLDVEGYEVAALDGARQTIVKHRPFMWIEYWKTGLDTLVNELAYLKDYDHFVVDPLNVLFVPREKMREYELEIRQG
jgi:FkbM family methyltransferase